MSAFTGELVISGEKVATVSVPVSGTLSATIVAAKAAVMVVINEQLEKAGASAEADKGDVYEDAADEDVPEAKPQPPKRQKKEKGGK